MFNKSEFYLPLKKYDFFILRKRLKRWEKLKLWEEKKTNPKQTTKWDAKQQLFKRPFTKKVNWLSMQLVNRDSFSHYQLFFLLYRSHFPQQQKCVMYIYKSLPMASLFCRLHRAHGSIAKYRTKRSIKTVEPKINKIIPLRLVVEWLRY